MKSRMFYGTGILIIMLALTAFACGLGEPASGTPEAAGTAESPQTPLSPEADGTVEAGNPTVAAGATAAESTLSPEQAAETDASQIEAAKTALSERYDGETAFIAVAAAMERGYTFEQISAASIAGRLDTNGTILADDNTIVTPDGPPAGVLDLSTLESGLSNGRPLRPAAKPFVQSGRISATELLRGLEGLSASSETVANEDDEFRFVVALLAFNASGYSLDQIVEAIVLGYRVGYLFKCGLLVDLDGKPVKANQSNDDESGCYQFLFGRRGVTVDPDSEPVAGEESEAADEEENLEEGDVAQFCEIYSEFSADVKRSIDEYTYTDCGENCDQILDDLEIRSDGYIDRLAEVAPPEIKETMTQLAAETVAGFSSSEGRPDLQPLVEAMDNYAGEACGISFIGE